MTRKAYEDGMRAEKRVVALARQLWLSARLASSKEDYGNKTDVVIDGRPIQVSVQPKYKKQRKGLRKRGIENVAAGEHIDDSIILAMLRNLFNLD